TINFLDFDVAILVFNSSKIKGSISMPLMLVMGFDVELNCNSISPIPHIGSITFLTSSDLDKATNNFATIFPEKNWPNSFFCDILSNVNVKFNFLMRELMLYHFFFNNFIECACI